MYLFLFCLSYAATYILIKCSKLLGSSEQNEKRKVSEGQLERYDWLVEEGEGRREGGRGRIDQPACKTVSHSLLSLQAPVPPQHHPFYIHRTLSQRNVETLAQPCILL